ncbi:glyoxalase family protein [Lentithecium fluviatile CBS 122367]|uniref:Glyoxalase family protein n=1 Tax=Lentithecium fluviatile CBS 122367 TaxID=1168545 RepID=A0A6G1IUU0_9PLEO|nr:glyoxalase family protein [Lentithecium fluviatile CBS 122367]
MTSPTPKGNKFCNAALRVANLDRSASFYADVLGMKELHRTALEKTDLVFLGYPDSFDANTPLSRREGVLELVAKKNSYEDGGNAHYHSNSGFIKLAFHVSNLPEFMKRVREKDVKVVKEAGASDAPQAVASFLHCEPADLRSDTALWEALKEVCFVEDPDGYLIEIVPY